MKNALLKFLYLIIVVSYSSIAYAANNPASTYSIEKSWIDIPLGSFILNITKDKKLNKLINQYHKIEKRRLENFHYRINILNEISQYIKIHLVRSNASLLLNKFDKMVKNKAWYLEKVIKLYSPLKKDTVKIFSDIGSNDNIGDILYLRNSIYPINFKMRNSVAENCR